MSSSKKDKSAPLSIAWGINDGATTSFFLKLRVKAASAIDKAGFAVSHSDNNKLRIDILVKCRATMFPLARAVSSSLNNEWGNFA